MASEMKKWKEINNENFFAVYAQAYFFGHPIFAAFSQVSFCDDKRLHFEFRDIVTCVVRLPRNCSTLLSSTFF